MISMKNFTKYETDEASGEQTVLSPFTSIDLKEGKSVNESIFKGKKVTMVNIWATFCGPCLSELPALGEIAEEYKDKSFQVIGIPVDVADQVGNVSDAQVTIARSIIERKHANYLHILPSKSLVQRKLSEVYSVPETIFVDETGRQLGESYIGSRSKAEWKQIISLYLK